MSVVMTVSNTARQGGDILADVLRDLSRGNDAAARATIKSEYPFKPRARVRRTTSRRRILKIAARDGFIDRYTKKKLIYPAALAVVSAVLTNEFPVHQNWKMEKTHMAYWELFPSLDHIVPVARGGDNSDNNIVLTSPIKNAAKANWTLKELEWKLYAPGNLKKWDGLLVVTTELINRRSDLLENAYIKKWHNTALNLFPHLKNI